MVRSEPADAELLEAAGGPGHRHCGELGLVPAGHHARVERRFSGGRGWGWGDGGGSGGHACVIRNILGDYPLTSMELRQILQMQVIDVWQSAFGPARPLQSVISNSEKSLQVPEGTAA